MTMPDKETDDFDIDFGDPILNDPNYEQNVGNENNGEGDTLSPAADTPPSTDTPTQGDADGVDTVEGGTGDTNAPEQQRQGDKDTDRSRVRADDKRNLVDAEGNIIAAAGAERRHFERAQAQQRHITQLERDLAKAREDNQFARALNEMPQRLGLDGRETELGLQVVSSFKKDPVATARWALQETMRMGYSLKDIVGADAQGQPTSSSLDLQAVQRMISDAVRPLVGDREVQQRENEQLAAAERAYNKFIADHDYADVHQDVIGRMIQQDTGTTPETAYWQLKAFAAQHQLDFTQPLDAQLKAKQGDGTSQNGNAPRNTQQQQTRTPMPNGGSPTANLRDGPQMADAESEWEQIVADAMREQGIV